MVTVSIRKGDVFLVNFNPTIGSEVKKIRPAVVVSNDLNNSYSPIISIVPITSNITRVYSFEVEIPAGVGGLTERSKVMINQTRAVDKSRLMKRLGALGHPYDDKIDKALKLHYDLK